MVTTKYLILIWYCFVADNVRFCWIDIDGAGDNRIQDKVVSTDTCADVEHTQHVPQCLVEHS